MMQAHIIFPFSNEANNKYYNEHNYFDTCHFPSQRAVAANEFGRRRESAQTDRTGKIDCRRTKRR